MFKCECGKEFEKHQSLNAHKSWCKCNHQDSEIKMKRGRAWSKGQTKETNEAVKRIADTIKQRINEGSIIPSFTDKKHTDETKKQMSESRSKYIEEHNNYGLHWFEIWNGSRMVKIQGTWELKVANWLNDKGIKWDRTRILYNKNRHYTPDFYLPEHKCYIEVKGWMKDRDIFKMNIVLSEHNIELKLIEKNEIDKLELLSIDELPLFTDKYKDHKVDLSLFDVRY